MSITRTFNAWRIARRTANELQGLSDRELSDMGMARTDIYAIAHKAASAAAY